VAGSANNPFSSLPDAQAYYRTTPNAQTSLNPVTYVFSDNGTYGSETSLYLFSAYENVVCTALNTNILGSFVIDGTSATGVVAQIFAGANFVQPGPSTLSLMTVKNFPTGVQYTLHLQNVIFSANYQVPSTLTTTTDPLPVDDVPGVLHFEIGQGASLLGLFTAVAMINQANGDVLTVVGNDALFLGTTFVSSMDSFSADALGGGKCLKIVSKNGLENNLVTLSSTTRMVNYGPSPTVAISSGWNSSSTEPAQVSRVFSYGLIANQGLGNALEAWTGSGSSNYTLLNAVVSTASPSATTYLANTKGRGSSALDASNSDVTAQGGTVVKVNHASTASSSIIFNGGCKVLQVQDEPTENPLIQLLASQGDLSWLSGASTYAANHLPGVYAIQETIGGSSAYTTNSNASFYTQRGPLAHLGQNVMTEASTMNSNYSNNQYTSHSGIIWNAITNTTGTKDLSYSQNSSQQLFDTPHPLFRFDQQQGTQRVYSTGARQSAKTMGDFAIQRSQSGGSTEVNSYDGILLNPNGSGMRRTYSGNSVFTTNSLGLQSDVKDTSVQYRIAKQAVCNLVYAQSKTVSPVAYDIQNSEDARTTLTLEGAQTNGGVMNLLGPQLTTRLNNASLNRVQFTGGSHAVSGCVAQQILGNENASINIRNTDITNVNSPGAALTMTGSSRANLSSCFVTNENAASPALQIGTPAIPSDASSVQCSVLNGAHVPGTVFANVEEGSSFFGNTLNIDRNSDPVQTIVEGLGSITLGTNVVASKGQVVSPRTVFVNNTYPTLL
jgi:hypothetical protein